MAEDDPVRTLLNQTIGDRVARERTRSVPAKTQSDLAASVGVSRAAICAVEAGRQGLSLLTLCRIAVALGISPANLLPDGDEMQQLLEASGIHDANVPPEEIVNRFVKTVEGEGS